MAKTKDLIKRNEEAIEEALWLLERENRIDDALAAYRGVEAELVSLDLSPDDPSYVEQQRVLANCLMRQGNALRQLGRPQEALALSERETSAARASCDEIARARSLMSAGVNRIVSGQAEQGLQMLEEARVLFVRGDSYDHKQGLGWFWILQADLINGSVLNQDTIKAIEAADRAMEILMSIENWAGVARAYAARAQGHETMGDTAAAAADRESQSDYEDRSKAEEGNE